MLLHESTDFFHKFERYKYNNAMIYTIVMSIHTRNVLRSHLLMVLQKPYDKVHTSPLSYSFGPEETIGWHPEPEKVDILHAEIYHFL